MTKADCLHFAPIEPLFDSPCRYWKNAGVDHKGEWYPGHCSHKEVFLASCYAGRLWRVDSDDDGEE